MSAARHAIVAERCGHDHRVGRCTDCARAADPTILKVCPTCGARYTRETWAALEYCGVQTVDDEPPIALELRHCACGSTIAVDCAEVAS